MKKRDLITLEDMSSKEIFNIMKIARKLKKYPLLRRNLLRDRTLALLFQKPSNRTRVSFEVAAVHLGGYVLYLSPREIKMGVREPVKDVARVISRYVDGIVARVFKHEDIQELSRYSDVPVINGLSDLAHPCQALSDIFTINEMIGTLRNVKVAYVGDGNNVLNSLMMVCAKTGVDITAATPNGYEPDMNIFGRASAIAGANSSEVRLCNDPYEAVRGCNVVYTDVWTSMGQEEEKEKRLVDFSAFQVNSALMREAGEKALIMHCLPAHRGEEITDVIDGKNSVVYDQAENRMHVQKAILFSMFRKRKVRK